MSSTTKNFLAFILILLGAYVAYRVTMVLLPWIIVAGVVYGVYHFYGRKALGGGRRTLP